MSATNQLPNLDKIFRGDDEPDFLPSGGSNLAAIFGTQSKVQDAHSLPKPQIHKKPNNGRPVQTLPTNKTEVIIAKVVDAFKLQNELYVSIGKLGMALTGNASTRTYQIILYKSNQEHVSIVTVNYDFSYTVQKNNYSSYYDNKKDNWSVFFENSDVCTEFAREVGLARYFSKPEKIKNIVYQDLTPISNDTTAKEGDNIDIKYFIAAEVTQPFKHNSITMKTMTVQISTDNNWERILLGTNKGLKRVLILPPSKQISLGPGFPKVNDVMLEIEIVDIRVGEENLVSHNTGIGAKASIISRMAKMGQSMLSKVPTSTSTDSEDTEDDIPRNSPRHKRVESLGTSAQQKSLFQELPQDTAKHAHKGLKSKIDILTSDTNVPKPLVPASTFAPQFSPTQIQPNFVTLDGQVYSLQSQPIPPTMPTTMDPSINILVSETRMANAELRMGMSKIADNVQKLLDKFHVLELQNAGTPTNEKSVLDATLKMLLAINAPQIGIKERELHRKSNNNSAINDTAPEFNEVKPNVITLEKELNEVKESLANSLEHVKSLETEKESVTSIVEDFRVKNQDLETCIKNISEALDKTKDELEAVKELNNQYKEENLAMKTRISKLVEEYSALKRTANSLEEKDNEKRNKEIKHIMNRTYHTLLERFEKESYSTDYIKSTIASTIKNITLQILYEPERKVEEEVSVNVQGTDLTNNESSHHESTLSNKSIVQPPPEQAGVSTSALTNISAAYDEPPPIPDNETEVDWWP